MSLVLNIRGANASGKSTVVKQFINRTKNEIIDVNGSVVTYLPFFDAYVLGRYDCSSGGCDRYSGFEEVSNTIIFIIKKYAPKLIIYEGMLYGKTFKSTFLLSRCVERFGYSFICVVLYRKFSRIVELLEERNGGKNFNTANVLNVYEAVNSSAEKLRKNNIIVYRVNADNIKKEKMFLIIYKVLEIEGICL